MPANQGLLDDPRKDAPTMNVTIMALFETPIAIQQTIADLVESTAIHQDDIMVVAMDSRGQYHPDLLADADRLQLLNDVVRLGALIGACVGGLFGALSSLAIAGRGLPPSLFLGVLCGVVIGALIGIAAASLLGGITTLGASDVSMHIYGEGMQRGATLLGVIVPDATVLQVEGVLRRHGAAHLQKRHGAWRLTQKQLA